MAAELLSPRDDALAPMPAGPLHGLRAGRLEVVLAPEAGGRIAQIRYDGAEFPEDKVMEAAIEAGADDVQSDEDGHQIWTQTDGMHDVAKALEASLGEASAVKLAWKPTLTTEVTGDSVATLMKLVDALEDDDDVQTVWGNYDISDEELEKLG